MTKTDAIKLAILHLDGEAHEWWYHGLMTSGDDTTTSYSDFTERLMGKFDKRYPDIHFRELEQLKQTSKADAFVREFQIVAIMVIDVSEGRLVILFTLALKDHLCG